MRRQRLCPRASIPGGGPWQHLPWGDRRELAEFGSEALLDTNALLLRWFNHWLKDSGEFSGEPRIRHFVLGENSWAQAQTWPSERAHSWYCTAPDWRIPARATVADRGPARSEEPCDLFIYDPEVPVLAPGGRRRRVASLIRRCSSWATTCWSTPPGRLLRRFVCSVHLAFPSMPPPLPRIPISRRSWCGSGPTDAEFICIGIARSSWLFPDASYAADTVHLGNSTSNHVLPFRSFRPGPARDRQQRLSAL